MVAEHRHHEGGGRAEHHQGQRHAVPHLGGPGGADIDAIEQIGEHRQERHHHQVRQIEQRAGAHRRQVGQELDQGRPAQRQDQADQQGEGQAPIQPGPDRLAQAGPIARPGGMADQGLGGIGEAVQAEGGEVQEVQEHGVGGQRHLALARAQGRDADEGRLQAEAAQHDVPVDLEQPAQGRQVEHGGPAPGARQMAEPAPDQPAGQRCRPMVGDHRGRGHAGHRPAEAEHEQDRQHDVQAVAEQQHQERPARVLHAEQPADQDHADQRRRRRQEPDLEIGRERRRDPGTRLEQPGGDLCDRPAQQQQQAADQERQEQRPDQAKPQLGAIGGTMRLGHQPGGAHAQRDHREVQGREGRRAQRHAAQIMRLRQMADHGRVGHADQGHGDVGEDQRPGEAPQGQMRRRPGRPQALPGHGRRSLRRRYDTQAMRSRLVAPGVPNGMPAVITRLLLRAARPVSLASWTARSTISSMSWASSQTTG